jgi:hypothetical protein
VEVQGIAAEHGVALGSNDPDRGYDHAAESDEPEPQVPPARRVHRARAVDLWFGGLSRRRQRRSDGTTAPFQTKGCGSSTDQLHVSKLEQPIAQDNTASSAAPV